MEACRRNNTELLTETLEGKGEDEIAKLLNETTTVMGNHLYHEAALQGNCMFWASHSHLSYITSITMSPIPTKIHNTNHAHLDHC